MEAVNKECYEVMCDVYCSIPEPIYFNQGFERWGDTMLGSVLHNEVAVIASQTLKEMIV